MPRIVRVPSVPPAPDYYMVIGLDAEGQAVPTHEAGVPAAAQVLVLTGTSEEEAVEKAAELLPTAVLFTAQVVPTFPRPGPEPTPPPKG